MSLTLQDEWLKWFDFLPDDASRGRLIRGVVLFALTGTEPEDLQGAEIGMFNTIKKAIRNRKYCNEYYSKRKGKSVNHRRESVNHRICESQTKNSVENELKSVNHICESQISAPDLTSNQHLNTDSLNSRIIKDNTGPLLEEKQPEILESQIFQLEAQDENETSIDAIERELKTRISRLYHRREKTPWNEKETKRLKEISRREDVLNEMSEIETLYNSDYPYRRTDMQTFLNNFSVELDRARNTHTKPKIDRNKKGF